MIEDILRSEFGFDGIVMTDWVIAMMEAPNSTYRNALSSEVAKAGGDLFMPGGKADYKRLMEAFKAAAFRGNSLRSMHPEYFV